MQEDCKAALAMENPELGGSRLTFKMAPDRKIFSDKNNVYPFVNLAGSGLFWMEGRPRFRMVGSDVCAD